MMIRKHGFTLLEVLIVITIVALISAVAFSAFRMARQRSLEGSCISNLRQVYMALDLYCEEQGGWEHPPVTLVPTYAYAKGPGIYACPAETILKPYDDGTYQALILDINFPVIRSPFKIDYAYVRDYPWFDQDWAWNRFRPIPNAGVLACPFHGNVVCTAVEAQILKHLRTLDGPILRMCFDGHLFRVSKRHHRSGSVSTADLFHWPISMAEFIKQKD